MRGFDEFLARIPKAFLDYQQSYSHDEINQAIQTIFPLAHTFFWNQFKTRSKETALVAELSRKLFLDLANNKSLSDDEQETIKQLQGFRREFSASYRRVNLKIDLTGTDPTASARELTLPFSFLKAYPILTSEEKLKSLRKVITVAKEML